VFSIINQEIIRSLHGRAFDGVVSSYNQLADTVLQTLHFEARCRVIRSVGRTMGATYQLDPMVNEPDPEIVNLNADLVAFDEDVLTHLPVRQHEYVVSIGFAR
jgi:exocyst complex component 4